MREIPRALPWEILRITFVLGLHSATHMLDPGLGPAFPCPAPKLSNSAVVGSSPAANMSKVGAQSSAQPGSAANAGSLMHSSKARVLSNAVLKGP